MFSQADAHRARLAPRGPARAPAVHTLLVEFPFLEADDIAAAKLFAGRSEN
ncbi:MAG: hypothetical protein ACT4OF_07230 [Caulobacteraceae bacterium]